MKQTVSSESFLRYPQRVTNENQESQKSSERELIYSKVRELIRAQFQLADQELTKRLWQDVADSNFDKDRIIHLMYRCSFHDDDNAMFEADLLYQND